MLAEAALDHHQDQCGRQGADIAQKRDLQGADRSVGEFRRREDYRPQRGAEQHPQDRRQMVWLTQYFST